MGAINGVLVAYGRVPSIIVTLGTLAIYRALLVELSGAKTVTTDALPTGWSTCRSANLLQHRRLRHPADGRGRAWSWSSSSSSSLGYLPLRPPALRHRLEPGGGAAWPACRRGAIVFIAFVLCGALAGLAGFMFLVRFGNITVVAGAGPGAAGRSRRSWSAA